MKKIFTLLLILSLFLMAGCAENAGTVEGEVNGDVQNEIESKVENETEKSVAKAEEEDTLSEITLYFADFQAQYVIPEKRTVDLENKKIEEVVIEELLKGPEDPYLKRTIPEGIEVNKVTSQNGTVTIDFSDTIYGNFPQGSSGESIFYRSILYSLTEIEGIDEVVIKVEGEIPEELGHMDVSEPLKRGSIATYKVFVDKERCEWLQKEVDQNRQAWRKDPLEVAKFDGKMAGFTKEDKFTLVSLVEMGEYSGTGEAVVEVEHDNKIYVLELIQPVKIGEDGIWVINDIREK